MTSDKKEIKKNTENIQKILHTLINNTSLEQVIAKRYIQLWGGGGGGRESHYGDLKKYLCSYCSIVEVHFFHFNFDNSFS